MKAVFFVLFSIFVVCFLGCSDKSVNSTNSTTTKDNAYSVAQSYISDLGYTIDQNGVNQKDVSGSRAALMFIFNKNRDTCGSLFSSGDVCNFALFSEKSLREFEVSMNSSGTFGVVKKSEILPEENEEPKVSSLNKKSSYGICQYISEAGFSIGCWSLPDNPLAYYYIVTTKVGDPITAFHQLWCADWLGNCIVCPLNAVTTNVLHCGPPSL